MANEKIGELQMEIYSLTQKLSSLMKEVELQQVPRLHLHNAGGGGEPVQPVLGQAALAGDPQYGTGLPLLHNRSRWNKRSLAAS